MAKTEKSFSAVMGQGHFHGRSEGAESLARHAAALLPDAPGRTILDLGCGTGDLALALMRHRPESRVTGIDLSPANIEEARRRSDAILFLAGDYLDWRTEPFAMMVADSVLHLIDAPLDAIAAKIAGDLLPGGLVVATVPDAALRNRALLLLRRLYRLTPPATDRLAVSLAGLLHPRQSRQALADRMPYMRNIPRLFGAAEQQQFARAGLVLLAADPMPNPSLAKPRHCLMVWRRV